MSRIGKKPISVPGGVKIDVLGGSVRVEGPKGRLSWSPHADMVVEYDGSENRIVVKRPSDQRHHRALHGLTRSLLANMVEGVTEGFSRALEIYGTGYGCKVQGEVLQLNVGFINAVDLPIPEGVTVAVEAPNARGNDVPAKLSIAGPDKQKIGQFAADIRRTRPPEPYKGKGVRYVGEVIRRKQGKALAGSG